VNPLPPQFVIPDLIRDPCSKTTTVRAKPVGACASLNVGSASGKPGLAPAGDSLSLASPRESKQREGDPMGWVPALRCGQPAVLAESGVELELASLRQSLALIRFRLRSSAQPDGWGKKCGCGFGKARTRKARPRRSPMAYPNPLPTPTPIPIPIPPPFCMRRGAEVQTDQGWRCLSEASLARPRLDRAPQVALRSVSGGGTQTVGSPFLLLTFLLATQKKSELPPGNPRLAGTPQTVETKTAPTGSVRAVAETPPVEATEAPHAKQQTTSDAREAKK
jgi:hypothetical protein